MSISQLTLVSVLEKIGAVLDRKNGVNYWYYSPFRKEKTASFHVKVSEDIWYDFGEEMGGGINKFVAAYLEREGEDHTEADVARWLGNMGTLGVPPGYFPKEEDDPKCPVLKIEGVTELSHPALLKYLDTRCIDHGLARRHLKQVFAYNSKTGKNFFSIGFRNMDGGFELRNAQFKSCIAPKTITFIRGTYTSGDDVNIFEGGFDFIAALHCEPENRLKGDSIILNSNINLSRALPFIHPHTYKNIHTWFDNDLNGKKATEAIAAFAKEKGLKHVPENDRYQGHKDVNAWHIVNMNQQGSTE